jgi:hypothetical protein
VSERLSPSDMSSLLAERGPIHVHVGATTIMEGEPPDFDELLEHVDARLPSRSHEPAGGRGCDRAPKRGDLETPTGRAAIPGLKQGRKTMGRRAPAAAHDRPWSRWSASGPWCGRWGRTSSDGRFTR